MFIAAKRADALLDEGDVRGCSAWVQIAKAIDELKRKQPDHADKLH